jgi:hypothetical protein
MKRNNLLFIGLALLVINSSCEETLEKSLTGKKVILQAPVNNLSTTDTQQTFYWQKSDGALTYQLQIVSPRFDSIVKFVVDTPLTGTMFHTTLGKGNYQWKVRGKNNSTVSDFSDAWHMTIQ